MKKFLIITALLVVFLFLLYFIPASISVFKQDRLWRKQYFSMRDVADAILLYVDDHGMCPNSIDILVEKKYLGTKEMGRGFKEYIDSGEPDDYKFIPPPMVITNVDTAPPMIVPADDIYYSLPKKEFSSNAQKTPTQWTKLVNTRLYFMLDKKGVIKIDKEFKGDIAEQKKSE